MSQPLRRFPVTRQYAFRGRLADAAKNSDDSLFRINADGMGLLLALARAGSIPPSRAGAVFDQVARDGNVAFLPFANAWWASQVGHGVAHR